MRVRLRPAWDEDELATLYARPHDHHNFPSHQLRVDHTVALGQALLREAGIALPAVADLSCGNAEIPRALSPCPVLGDLAPGYALTGPIEHTIVKVTHVDLFVLSETLEHLDEPEGILTAIRKCASLLLTSTPLGETEDTNPEHYWGWDQDGVRDMLAGAGWAPVLWSTVTMPDAAFQIWGCR